MPINYYMGCCSGCALCASRAKLQATIRDVLHSLIPPVLMELGGTLSHLLQSRWTTSRQVNRSWTRRAKMSPSVRQTLSSSFSEDETHRLQERVSHMPACLVIY